MALRLRERFPVAVLRPDHVRVARLRRRLAARRLQAPERVERRLPQEREHAPAARDAAVRP